MGLRTTGRRTGAPHLVMVGYVENGPNLVTLAMNGWADTQPAWRLITRRSRVQIPPPLPPENPGTAWVFFIYSVASTGRGGPYEAILKPN